MQKKKLALFSFIFLFILLNELGHSQGNKGFKSKFSIKFNAGPSSIAIGDINESLNSINRINIFEYWRRNDPDRVVGEITMLNSRTFDWEAELRVDIRPRIGLAIATSAPLQKMNDDSLVYTYVAPQGNQITTIKNKPVIKVGMPIKLTFYYSPLSGKRVNPYFSVGAGFYSAKMSENRYYEVIWPTGGVYAEKRIWEAHRNFSLGFHGGGGIEFAFLRNIGFFMEIQGRLIKMGGLKGKMAFENNFGEKYTTIGTLYSFSMWDDNIAARYRDLEVWEKPEHLDFREPTRVRKAILDLSGFSIRIGIRIGLY